VFQKKVLFSFFFCIINFNANFTTMKKYLFYILLVNLTWGQNKTPFTIDVRPRVIDNAKILVNVEVINHMNQPVDYIEGFLSEFSENNDLLSEKRMVLVYNYEPALQSGFSTTKTIKYELNKIKPPQFKFHISKVKFSGDNRVFAWHSESGFIRID
tara:strand:- start:180 stop:647 length:468 start_codon:yes stop_codon:yes gene_type:complete